MNQRESAERIWNGCLVEEWQNVSSLKWDEGKESGNETNRCWERTTFPDGHLQNDERVRKSLSQCSINRTWRILSQTRAFSKLSFHCFLLVVAQALGKHLAQLVLDSRHHTIHVRGCERMQGRSDAICHCWYVRWREGKWEKPIGPSFGIDTWKMTGNVICEVFRLSQLSIHTPEEKLRCPCRR